MATGLHGDEHPVGAAAATDLLLFPATRRRARAGRGVAASRRHAALGATWRLRWNGRRFSVVGSAALGACSTPESHRDAPVADDDDGAGYQILQHQAVQCTHTASTLPVRNIRYFKSAFSPLHTSRVGFHWREEAWGPA